MRVLLLLAMYLAVLAVAEVLAVQTAHAAPSLGPIFYGAVLLLFLFHMALSGNGPLRYLPAVLAVAPLLRLGLFLGPPGLPAWCRYLSLGLPVLAAVVVALCVLCIVRLPRLSWKPRFPLRQRVLRLPLLLWGPGSSVRQRIEGLLPLLRRPMFALCQPIVRLLPLLMGLRSPMRQRMLLLASPTVFAVVFFLFAALGGLGDVLTVAPPEEYWRATSSGRLTAVLRAKPAARTDRWREGGRPVHSGLPAVSPQRDQDVWPLVKVVAARGWVPPAVRTVLVRYAAPPASPLGKSLPRYRTGTAVSRIPAVRAVPIPADDLVEDGNDIATLQYFTADSPERLAEALSLPAPAASPQEGSPECPGWGYENGYPYGVCTWYAKARRPDLPWFAQDWGYAVNWARAAELCGFPVDGQPAAGDVIVFPPGANGAYDGGHVAYVEEVGADYVLTSECNVDHSSLYIEAPMWWEGDYPCGCRRIPLSGLDPGVQFIHRQRE